MHSDDIEHPDTMQDALSINAAGGADYRTALGELAKVAGTLFDGIGKPGHVGASKLAEDIFGEFPPPHAGVRLFVRQFWGSNGKSIVAALGLKGSRPALLAIIPVDLGLQSGKGFSGAEAHALKLARVRCAAM